MLKKQYDEKLAQKEELRKKSEEMQLKLERAGMLVSGLAGEKARWEETLKVRAAPSAGLQRRQPSPREPSPPLRNLGVWNALGESAEDWTALGADLCLGGAGNTHSGLLMQLPP